MDITYYIDELNKYKVTMTANPNTKSAIMAYLEKEKIKYVCTMDDYFQYTIQLV